MGKVIKIPIGHQSRETWVAERQTYLGGSDVGTVFGLNDYMSRVELFYQKLGEITLNPDNSYAFMGRFFEEPIAQLFKYWDGDTDSVVNNYNAGRVIRDVRRTNFRYVHEDYPWISCNLDRFFKEQNGRRGLIDCKNMMYWVERKWEAGIPPYHVMQVTTYMGVLGMKHSYIVVLVGGNRLEVYPIEFNQEIFDSIVETTRDFWNRVEQAKALINKHGWTGNRLVAELSYRGIEPDGENNEAYEAFLKKRQTPEEGFRPGTEELLDVARALEALKGDKDLMVQQEVDYRCQLLEAIGNSQGLEWFGTGNKVTWYPNKNGVRTLRLNLVA